MYRLRHPFSGHIYGALGDGLVEVEKDGRRGVFDRYGFWLRGEIRMADAEMCRWLGTHTNAAPSRHRAGFDDPARNGSGQACAVAPDDTGVSAPSKEEE